MVSRITYDNNYQGYKINTNKDKGYGCFEKALSVYHAHLNDMCNKHNKVWQQRFDLRYPADGSIKPDPKHRHTFSEKLTKDLKRNFPLKEFRDKSKDKPKNRNQYHTDPRLIMVCEEGKTSEKVHIHGLVLVNGNAKRNSKDIFTRIERQWANALNIEEAKGLVDYCNKSGPNSYMLNRNDSDFEQKLNDASHQASYLAKVKDKAGLPKGQWLVSATRLPRDAKTAFNINNNNPSDEV